MAKLTKTEKRMAIRGYVASAEQGRSRALDSASEHLPC